MVAQKNALFSLPPTLASSPLLMISHRKRKQLQTFFNLHDKSQYHRSITEMSGKIWFGCFYGWLVLVDESIKECFLLCLTYTSKIVLPPIPNMPELQIRGAILSSPPTRSSCTIFVIFSRQILFCRKEDKEWTKLISEEFNFNRVDDELSTIFASCRGKIYVLTDFDDLVVIDTRSSSMSSSPTINFVEMEAVPVPPAYNRMYWVLMESSGELFLVVRSYSILRRGPPVSVDFYKLDISEHCWYRVDSIGHGRAFFLGGKCGASRLADEVGVRGNCVYFIDACGDGIRLYKYSLDRCAFSFDLLWPKYYSNARSFIWVLPAAVA